MLRPVVKAAESMLILMKVELTATHVISLLVSSFLQLLLTREVLEILTSFGI